MTTESLDNKKINKTGNEITLKELIFKIQEWWRYLLSKWVIIFIGCILGGILGFTYAYLKRTIYVANTTFVLENGEKSGGLGQYAGIASMMGVDLGGGGGIFQEENIPELYKSRPMVERALLSEVERGDGKRELLIDRYINFNNYRKSLDEKKETENISFVLKKNQKFNRIQDSLISVFVEQINKGVLKVDKPDKRFNIIQVSVNSKDELFSKAFNEQIVSNVNDFYVATKTKKSLENLNILQHQTDSVRNVLNGAIYESIAITDATPNLNPTRQVLRAPAQRSVINTEANKAMLSELVKNLELSKISYRKELPLIQIIEQPVYPLEKIKPGKGLSFLIGAFIAGFTITLILLVRRIILKATSLNN